MKERGGVESIWRGRWRGGGESWVVGGIWVYGDVGLDGFFFVFSLLFEFLFLNLLRDNF